MGWFSDLCRSGETDCPSDAGKVFGHKVRVGYFDKVSEKPFRVTSASIDTARYVLNKHSSKGDFYVSEFCERCGKIGGNLYLRGDE